MRRRLYDFVKYYITIVINLFSELFAVNISFFRVLRCSLLRVTGLKMKNTSFIDTGFRFLNPGNISIGKNVSLGHYNRIWAFHPIKIGDYVQTAIGVTIISGSHNVDDYHPKLNDQQVSLEGENWIGANVTILGGVTIGRGTIVGAGSVVVKDLPPYSVCAGNPCKVIKEREPANLVVTPFGKYRPKKYERDD